ncbi:hypothetical protein GCM10009844_31090 [Nocardioides koreensis]|uniref:Uncharacterized protein n=1 Tax=Nocardioides koreensis TaxID=433651 RepID=A0ABP5LN55_9ACTN
MQANRQMQSSLDQAALSAVGPLEPEAAWCLARRSTAARSNRRAAGRAKPSLNVPATAKGGGKTRAMGSAAFEVYPSRVRSFDHGTVVPSVAPCRPQMRVTLEGDEFRMEQY